MPVWLDVAAGASFLAAGVVAAGRSRRYAALAILAGVAWFAGDAIASAVLIHRPLMLHAALGYPVGRVRDGYGWFVLAVSWAGAVALPLGGSPAFMLALAALAAAAAWRVRLNTPLGRRAAAVTSARSVAALAGSLALPSAVRLQWPGAASSSELVALYAGLVTVAGLVLVAGLVVGAQARETDSVIELAQDTPGETLAALRREAASRADPAFRYALTAAVELLESNAALQAELAEKLDEVRASRRRLIDAALMERERLERVLADGAFRYLDELTNTLQALGEDGDGAARDLATACLDEVSRTRADLDQLARGLHPRVLVDRGLAAALADLAASCPIPVDVRAPPDRFPATVEIAVWYACAEALANVVKHARAETAVVEVRVESDELIASIRDDGAGGARTTPGGGLAGLADRLAAVDGRLVVESRVGGGTRLRIGIPLP